MLYFEHFNCREFFPNCSNEEISQCFRTGLFDNLLFLLMVLDGFRDYINRPIIITSSFRNDEHNKRVGGSPTSQHLLASAIDFICPSLPFESLVLHLQDFAKESALKRYLGQVIFYHKRKFIHLGLCASSHPNLTFLHYEQRDN